MAGIEIKTASEDLQTGIAIGLWQVGLSLKFLEEEIQSSSGKKTLRRITRIDSLASTLETVISPLVEMLDSVPEATSKVAVTLLLRALADGSGLLVRLRSVIAPCLGH